ncbi:hypothetical protein RKD30_003440 [Streptomyces pristinaespiralis]
MAGLTQLSGPLGKLTSWPLRHHPEPYSAYGWQ